MLRIRDTSDKMHVSMTSMQISCLLRFTTGTHVEMTLMNVTGFTLRVTLDQKKKIDPVACLLFSLVNSYTKRCIPRSQAWNRLATAEACFFYAVLVDLQVFFLGMDVKRKREKGEKFLAVLPFS